MTHTPLANTEQLWSDDALAHLAVDLSVGGKPQNVYAKLKIVRDDMQARIDELEAQLNEAKQRAFVGESWGTP